VVVANNDEVLIIVTDAQGFPEDVPVSVDTTGRIKARRDGADVQIGRIPEPINSYAATRGEMLFRCLTTGRTELLLHPGRTA
jgi:hypothetical protein